MRLRCLRGRGVVTIERAARRSLRLPALMAGTLARADMKRALPDGRSFLYAPDDGRRACVAKDRGKPRPRPPGPTRLPPPGLASAGPSFWPGCSPSTSPSVADAAVRCASSRRSPMPTRSPACSTAPDRPRDRGRPSSCPSSPYDPTQVRPRGAAPSGRHVRLLSPPAAGPAAGAPSLPQTPIRNTTGTLPAPPSGLR